MAIARTKTPKKAFKGQLFSLTTLIFILLMVATLLVFVTMGIGYDNLSESSALSASATDYGSILSKSASSFAYASGSTALQTLFEYEYYYPPYRGTNFITNLSQYMQYLMVNGIMPNTPTDTEGSYFASVLMSGETFQSYNALIGSVTGISSKQVSINESLPQIFQANPYSLNIRYTENVNINTSVGDYNYQIPVNVSIPLNNTPDLFYAEQGIYRPLLFSNPQGLATNIGNYYADSGNTVGFIYGTVYQVPSSTSSSCSGAGWPSGALSLPPYSSQIIIATVNAFSITGAGGCANNYGGLITQQINVQPKIPYLVYSQASNALSYLQTGQQVLLYGPGLSVMNISNLISTASSGSYFASPFATSYSDRVSGNFQRSSGNGIFTLFSYARQAAKFNGLNYIVTGAAQNSIVGYTIATWVYPTATSNALISSASGFGSSPTGSSLTLGYGNPLGCNNPPMTFFFGDAGSTFDIGVNSINQYPTNTWYFVAATFNGVGGTMGSPRYVVPTQFTLYVNGVAVPTGKWCGSKGTDTIPVQGINNIAISPDVLYSTGNFIGQIANFQIYNQTLTASQIYYLYQQGVEGIPISSTNMLGWYPLNGNSGDYSGAVFTIPPQGTAAGSYGLLDNYTRDNVAVAPVSSNTYPIPGLLSCNNNAQCSSNSLPHVYIGDMPLLVSNGGISAADFNINTASGIAINTRPLNSVNAITISAWINLNSIPARQEIADVDGDYFNLQNNQVCLFVGGVVASVYTCSNQVIPQNQWYFVAATSTGTTNTIYVNGATTSQYTTSSLAALHPISGDIGYCGSGSCLSPYQFYFNGLISNLQIYNESLTPAQLSALYHNGITAPPILTANVIGWYPLSGNANDYSGFGNNGNANSVSYRLIQQNYVSLPPNSYNSIGLSTITGSSHEWQTIGFPAPP